MDSLFNPFMKNVNSQLVVKGMETGNHYSWNRARCHQWSIMKCLGFCKLTKKDFIITKKKNWKKKHRITSQNSIINIKLYEKLLPFTYLVRNSLHWQCLISGKFLPYTYLVRNSLYCSFLQWLFFLLAARPCIPQIASGSW